MVSPPRRYTIDTDNAAPKKASVGRQALRREVNERAAAASRVRGATAFEALCECGLPGCAERFTVELETYDGVRRFATHFLIRPRHAADEERVIDDRDEFLVVEKFGRSGLAAVRADRRRHGTAASKG